MKKVFFVLIIVVLGLVLMSPFTKNISKSKDVAFADLNLADTGIDSISSNTIKYNFVNSDAKYHVLQLSFDKNIIERVEYVIINDNGFIDELESVSDNTYKMSYRPHYSTLPLSIHFYDSEPLLLKVKFFLKIDESNIADLNSSDFFDRGSVPKNHEKIAIEKSARNELLFKNRNDFVSHIFEKRKSQDHYEQEYVIKSDSDGFAMMISGYNEYIQISNKKVEYVLKSQNNKLKSIVVDSSSTYKPDDFNKWRIKRKSNGEKDNIKVFLNDKKIFDIDENRSSRMFFSFLGFSVPPQSTMTMKSYMIGENLD